jgi:hypothetical protein
MDQTGRVLGFYASISEAFHAGDAVAQDQYPSDGSNAPWRQNLGDGHYFLEIGGAEAYTILPA